MARWGFVFDQEKCIGCNACQMACKDHYDLEAGLFFRRAVTVQITEDGLNRWVHYSGACNHCADPACVKHCPTGAYYVREDDIVYAEADKGYISVHLKDGRTASMYGDLYSFYGNIRIFTHYAMLGPHAIVNGVYVEKYNMLSAELKGKVKINMTPPGYLAPRKVMKKIKEEREEKEDP